MGTSITASLAICLAACSLICCGPAPQSRTAEKKVIKKSEESVAPEVSLPRADQKLVAELKQSVHALSHKIGERNTKKHWELAAAADFIADQLTAAGYEVGRQGFEVDDVIAQNLEVDVRGTERGDEVLVVGAHYDSAPGSPGADDNASGTAALLSLARQFRELKLRRSVRFVFFANEEPPYFQTDRMGSVMYAKHALARGDRMVGMLSLESLGVFSDAKDSQRYPAELREKHPTTGNFIAVVSDTASAGLCRRFAKLMQEGGPVPVEHDALPGDLPGVGWSDHWAFWQIGVPAVMVTDTAPFRSAHYHKATDTADRLDYERMAHVVVSLSRSLRELANQPALPPRE
ncbi:MAG TPA: M20/M25/M40 family metallo-hydrolase [Polyangiaceae bacterium]|nr:M20/M25/M40 family metallo-hydrolase [Polyangiaceae bacterium]